MDASDSRENLRQVPKGRLGETGAVPSPLTRYWMPGLPTGGGRIAGQNGRNAGVGNTPAGAGPTPSPPTSDTSRQIDRWIPSTQHAGELGERTARVLNYSVKQISLTQGLASVTDSVLCCAKTEGRWKLVCPESRARVQAGLLAPRVRFQQNTKEFEKYNKRLCQNCSKSRTPFIL